MNSPFLALGWEYFRRVWPRFLLAAVCGLFITYLVATSVDFDYGNFVLRRKVSLVLVLNLIWFALPLLSAQIQQRSPNNAGMPLRWYRLPISTAWLVAVQMAFGGMAMLLLVLVVNTPFLGVGIGYWFPPIVYMFYAMAIVVGQALAWVMVGFVWIRMVVAALVSVCLIKFSLLLMDPPVTLLKDNGIEQQSSLAANYLTMALVILFCYLISVVFVSLDRRGIHWPGLSKVWDSLIPRRFRDGVRRKPFKSPISALTWYEWRHRGASLPFVALGLALILFAVARWVGHKNEYEGLVWALMFGVLPIVSYFVGGIAATTIGRHGSPSSALPAHLATKPVTAEILAAGRIRAAMLAVGLSWVISGLAFWYLLLPESVQMNRAYFETLLWILPNAVLTTWGLYAVGLASVSAGRTWFVHAVFTSLFGIPLILFFLASVSMKWESQLAKDLAIAAWVWFIAVPLVATAILYFFALRTRTVCTRELLLVTIGLLALAVLILTNPSIEAMLSLSRQALATITFVMMMAASVIQIHASLPLAIRWNRHR